MTRVVPNNRGPESREQCRAVADEWDKAVRRIDEALAQVRVNRAAAAAEGQTDLTRFDENEQMWLGYREGAVKSAAAFRREAEGFTLEMTVPTSHVPHGFPTGPGETIVLSSEDFEAFAETAAGPGGAG